MKPASAPSHKTYVQTVPALYSTRTPVVCYVHEMAGSSASGKKICALRLLWTFHETLFRNWLFMVGGQLPFQFLVLFFTELGWSMASLWHLTKQWFSFWIEVVLLRFGLSSCAYLMLDPGADGFLGWLVFLAHPNLQGPGGFSSLFYRNCAERAMWVVVVSLGTQSIKHNFNP